MNIKKIITIIIKTIVDSFMSQTKIKMLLNQKKMIRIYMKLKKKNMFMK